MQQNEINHKNQISKYTRRLFHNELDKFNCKQQLEFNNVLDKGCVYIPEYYCKKRDKTVYHALIDEINNMGDSEFMINWSKHHKIVKKLAHDFGITVMQTRLNYYVDQNDWKPFHHDRHAYHKDDGTTVVENYTLGVSFGYSRDLIFLHESSGKKFRFPQNNGDIFGFDSEVNKMFQHGVPKTANNVGPRLSIIIWGIKNI